MSAALNDPGVILLTVQLGIASLAMIAWMGVIRSQSHAALKRAALATAAWFAHWAAKIASLFDVGWLP